VEEMSVKKSVALVMLALLIMAVLLLAALPALAGDLAPAGITDTPTPTNTPTAPPGPTVEPTEPPVIPEASTLVLLGGSAASLAAYVGLQIRARRRS
jgi:hypothetical protein